jgi:hypothetical protein
MTFDFKKYHTRAINAHSDQERALINAELKVLYESLSEPDKDIFNGELQTFLVKEMGRLKSDYASIK